MADIKCSFAPDDPEVQCKEALGLYDIKDNIWIGNDRGPILYLDPVWAQTAAQVAAVQLGICMLRIQPKVWIPYNWRFKDKVKTIRTGEQAVDHIEKGGI